MRAQPLEERLTPLLTGPVVPVPYASKLALCFRPTWHPAATPSPTPLQGCLLEAGLVPQLALIMLTHGQPKDKAGPVELLIMCASIGGSGGPGPGLSSPVGQGLRQLLAVLGDMACVLAPNEAALQQHFPGCYSRNLEQFQYTHGFPAIQSDSRCSIGLCLKPLQRPSHGRTQSSMAWAFCAPWRKPRHRAARA